jgi:hypothetical protein
MDEDRFNMSVRKFLKQVGVTSQRTLSTGPVTVPSRTSGPDDGLGFTSSAHGPTN